MDGLTVLTLDKSARAGSDAVMQWCSFSAASSGRRPWSVHFHPLPLGLRITLSHGPWRTRTPPPWVQLCAEAYWKSGFGRIQRPDPPSSAAPACPSGCWRQRMSTPVHLPLPQNLNFDGGKTGNHLTCQLELRQTEFDWFREKCRSVTLAFVNVPLLVHIDKYYDSQEEEQCRENCDHHLHMC